MIFFLSHIYLEFQEVLEEPPVKRIHVDDNSHLLINLPHKRISMMHHMPLNESLEYEDLKIHIPGGATEEIVIHTDFAPPTPRLSFNEGQPTIFPVIFFFFFFIQITFLFRF